MSFLKKLVSSKSKEDEKSPPPSKQPEPSKTPQTPPKQGTESNYLKLELSHGVHVLPEDKPPDPKPPVVSTFTSSSWITPYKPNSIDQVEKTLLDDFEFQILQMQGGTTLKMATVMNQPQAAVVFFRQISKTSFAHVENPHQRLLELKSLPPHPNLLGTKGYLSLNNQTHLVYNFAPSVQSLKHYLANSPWDLKMAIRWLLQIAYGILHLHCHKIKHSNLLLENVLIDPRDLHIRLSEYGFSGALFMNDFSGALIHEDTLDFMKLMQNLLSKLPNQNEIPSVLSPYLKAKMEELLVGPQIQEIVMEQAYQVVLDISTTIEVKPEIGNSHQNCNSSYIENSSPTPESKFPVVRTTSELKTPPSDLKSHPVVRTTSELKTPPIRSISELKSPLIPQNEPETVQEVFKKEPISRSAPNFTEPTKNDLTTPSSLLFGPAPSKSKSFMEDPEKRSYHNSAIDLLDQMAPPNSQKAENLAPLITLAFATKSHLTWPKFAEVVQQYCQSPPHEWEAIIPLIISKDPKQGVSKDNWKHLMEWYTPLYPNKMDRSRCSPPGFLLSDIVDVVSQPWFYGFLSTNESVEMLMNKPMGTFLVRFSSMPGHYALSVSSGSQVGHWRIRAAPTIQGVQFFLDERAYPSLLGLVQVHSVEPLQLLNSTDSTKTIQLLYPVNRPLTNISTPYTDW